MVETKSRERPVQALFRSYPAPFLDIKESWKAPMKKAPEPKFAGLLS
jgi:hypothetical protein